MEPIQCDTCAGMVLAMQVAFQEVPVTHDHHAQAQEVGEAHGVFQSAGCISERREDFGKRDHAPAGQASVEA